MKEDRPDLGAGDDYVMFGQSALFGDYADIIYALGGRLAKIVVNVPDSAPGTRKTFAQRVEALNASLRRRGLDGNVSVEPLETFEPKKGDSYVFGFRGAKLLPLRGALLEQFGIRTVSLIHPSAVVSPTASIGEGVIVNSGAVIASEVALGDFSLVNRRAGIGHDCVLESFANIGPGVNLASNVRVEREAVIGIGASVIEDTVIGAGSVVAGGAVVLRDVPPRTLVAGVPATIKKSLEA